MGGLIGTMIGTSRVTACSYRGSVSNGGASADTMGGLIGTVDGDSRVIGSSSSGTVSNGGAGAPDLDRMGGLIGRLNSTAQVHSSRSDSVVSNGGAGSDVMGGLIGDMAGTTMLIGSHASGAVSNGGLAVDAMGGLVGQINTITGLVNQIIGSSSSSTVSDGGDGNDVMGGLIGTIGGLAIVRDSYSSSMVCAAETSDCDASGNGADRVGGLIGYSTGRSDANNDPQIHNCLATGAVHALDTEDNEGGLIGRVANGSTSELNASMTNNRYDITTTTLSATEEVGSVPDLDMDGTANEADDLALLNGITGSTTTVLQVAMAYNNTWLTARWLFAMNAYPSLLYFDYDPMNPTTASPTAATTIDVCEAITPTNNTAVDEGEPDKPDCGDVLSAWPRP